MPAWLFLATSLLAPAPQDLPAAAAASTQPPRCRTDTRRRTVWGLARRPALAEYCRRLSRAEARRGEDPKGAEEDARRADALMPGTAAPSVVLGRLAAERGDDEAALVAFRRAEAIAPESVASPVVMLTLARSLSRRGAFSRAAAVYRRLVPRAALMPQPAQRVAVLLEATYVVLEENAGQPEPPPEALAYVREASRVRHHGLELDVAITLALVLDLSGRRAQADAIVSDLRGLRAWAERDRSRYLIHDEDRILLQAWARTQHAPQAAAQAFSAYARDARTTSPFAELAARRAKGSSAAAVGPTGRRGGR
ncbi:MAG: hypothetical protein AAF928_17000 [Myxococcota bacterium]